jgi:hypothetical protein
MSTSSDTTGNSNPSQLQQNLNSSLSSADTASTQTVQNLKLVKQARLSQLTRTAAALKAKYGAGNASVVAAEAAVSSGKATVSRISAVHQQIATPTPQVTATGWALQGMVSNSTLQPVAKLTVFLVDSKKTYQQQYGFAYTDSTGYFLINYAGDPAGGQAQTPPQLYIEIANASGKPIYLSTTAFSPAAGSITYQSIALPAGEKPIGDPPEAIRKVAIPNPKQGS